MDCRAENGIRWTANQSTASDGLPNNAKIEKPIRNNKNL